MKTVILAGGFGTRIRDVTDDIPKPMIPIGRYPIIWHIMKQYGHYGFKDFVLCLGHKGEIIKDYFLNYHHLKNDFTLDLKNNLIENHTAQHTIENWKITFSDTGEHALTGARIFRIKQYVEKDDYFLLTYGDGVSNLNIKKLVDFHRSHGKLMTVTGAHPPGRFGELELDENLVVGFNEKPQVSDGWISAGFFVCSRKVLDYLTPNEDLVFEKEPIMNLVKDKQLMVFRHGGFWHPMDTSRDYHFLNKLWNKNIAPWDTSL